MKNVGREDGGDGFIYYFYCNSNHGLLLCFNVQLPVIKTSIEHELLQS